VSDVLEVSDELSLPRSELEFRATRSGGPGGQHVNTSSTRIELLWNLGDSRALSDEQRDRLRQRLASRTDAAGYVRVVSSEYRSQLRNREAAEARLVELLRRALAVPRKRVATRPSRAAKEARLRDKRRQSEKKRLRRGEE
jgi:ribosome-associated protein